MTKHAARIQYPVVLFTALFLLLAGLCVYLQANRPLPAGGPDAVAEAVRGEAAVRSGALADPNREVRGLWIPSVLNITYPSRPGLDADTLRAELDDIVRVAREQSEHDLPAGAPVLGRAVLLCAVSDLCVFVRRAGGGG